MSTTGVESFIAGLKLRGVRFLLSEDELVVDAPADILSSKEKERLTANKQEIKYIIGREKLSAIKPHSYIDSDIPLSSIQKSLLLMDTITPNAAYSNNAYVFKVKGKVDVKTLESSLATLIDANEILRTRYLKNQELEHQRIMPMGSVPMAYEEYLQAGWEHEDLSLRLKAIVNNEIDICENFPCRFNLIKVSTEGYYFTAVFHQIACDGISAVNFFKALSALYSRLTLRSSYGADNEDTTCPVMQVANTRERPFYQYRDYIFWQKVNKSILENAFSRAYWKNILHDAPELHSFPCDFLRPAVQTFNGAIYEGMIAKELFQSLDSFASKNTTTAFSILQAAAACLISRYSGQDDMVIGTVAANRLLPQLQEMQGCFTNTLPLRFNINQQEDFYSNLERAKAAILGGLKHQGVPFDTIVRDVSPKRSVSYNPLVQLMVVAQSDQQGDLQLGELQAEPVSCLPDVSRFDLTLHIFHRNDSVLLRWEYSTALFKKRSIKNLHAHFLQLLGSMLASPSKSISSHALVSSERLNKVLRSNAPSPAFATLHAGFKSQAGRTPDKVAIYDGQKTYDYRALDEWSDAIARILNSLKLPATDGLPPRIAVYMEKSATLVAAMLGIFKAGAIYLPLDPSYPQKRIDFMLRDAGVSLVLVDGRLNDELAVSRRDVSIETVYEDLQGSHTKLNIKDDDQLNLAAGDADTPAYIIYTSGSTGQPKGVVVSHRSICYSLVANTATMNFSEDDLLPCLGSQSFGISLLEMLLPLINGAAVTMLQTNQVRDIDTLIELTKSATVLHAVPSLMEKWFDRVVEKNIDYPKLRLLLVGGEPVPHELLKRMQGWRNHIDLLELYGMTEASVVCSAYRPAQQFLANYCIGQPHPGTTFYVLNEHKHIQPTGVPGELYIGGDCVAEGYINQAQLSAERFIESPFSSKEKLYRTGDRVRRIENNHFEFLGRTDNQVSLRGVRIEYGEIESILMDLPSVKRAVVQVMEVGHHDQALVAYILQGKVVNVNANTNPNDEGDKSGQEITRKLIDLRLREYLPDYMRPTIIQFVNEFALNPNGKIDRKSLPAPTMANSFTEPETETEIRLANIWKSKLNLVTLGVDDNYFEVGGNSLSAASIINGIKDAFQIPLPFMTIFESPTIAQLAKKVEEKINEKMLSTMMYDDAERIDDEEEIII